MDVSEELLQRLSEEFDVLTATRHNEGAEEYGPLKFLENPLMEFIYEEIADIANYSRFLYIRLRILEEAASERGLDLSASLSEKGGNDNQVPYGPAAFSASGTVQGFLPDKEK